MLMGKTNNTVHPGYASYLRGTKTAEVEGLWLSEDPNACVKTPRCLGTLAAAITVIAAANVPRLGYALLLYFPPSIAWETCDII